MRSGVVSERIAAAPELVFELLHDYDRRLEWDTLLCEARLTGGHPVAGKGATSLCRGKMLGGAIALETRYVTYRAGEIAAVEMINRPLFFERFAASIRHEAATGGSTITYRYQFRARPGFLRWLLEPVMAVVLRYETAKRLKALARFMGRGGSVAHS